MNQVWGNILQVDVFEVHFGNHEDEGRADFLCGFNDRSRIQTVDIVECSHRVSAGFCIRHWDGTFEGVLLPELEMVATQDRDADLIENTRRVNAAIEQAIRMAPDNWLWLHDRWKTEEQRTRHRERAAAAL